MGFKTKIRRSLKARGVRVPWVLMRDSDRRVRMLAKRLQPGDVFLDLGAHVGEVSVECARRGAEVYAFEAHPGIFETLRERTRAYPNIHIFNEAVSHEDGEVTLYFRPPQRPGHYQGSTLAEGKADLDYQQSVKVPALRLSTILDRIGKPVRLVKMDVEGVEYRVLQTLIDEGRTAELAEVHVECHAAKVEGLPAQKAKVLEALAAAGLSDRYHFDWH